MKNIFNIVLFLASSVGALTSCEEDIIIDTESGDPRIGVFGGITTDMKHHRITISRTADFYSTKPIEMISGAEVFIEDQTRPDTFYLNEVKAGVYETDSVAGVMHHTYRLNVTVPDHGKTLHFYAESTIDTCPEKIDSVQVHFESMFDEVYEDLYKICPFFQTTKKDIYYMFDLSINRDCLTDTLTRKPLAHMGNFSGLYFNGEEMSIVYEEINAYPQGIYYLDQTLTREHLNIGDVLHITMYGIPKGFYGYINDITSSIGSNPLMGSPTNVRTNIHGKEKEAVGYFYAASCVHFYQKISKLPAEWTDVPDEEDR